MDLKSPALLHIAFSRIRGNPSRRLMVVLRTRGCTYALRPQGGCLFCGFKELSAKGQPVSKIDIIAQFEKGMTTYNLVSEKIQEIDIYNSGSFLSNKEVPAQARDEIFRVIAENPHILKVLIESRPEFIIDEEIHLSKLKNMVRDKILEMGIGLETASDDIRNNILHKGFKLSLFKKACEILASLKTDLLVYVLLKPPGFNEGDAIRDAIDTIYYLDNLRKDLEINIKVALQPTFVPRNTPLEKLYQDRVFFPPRLWSVIEVIRATFNLPIEIEIGLSDEGLSSGRVARNCDLCTHDVIQALKEFNQTQDRSFIAELKCPCKTRWKEELK